MRLKFFANAKTMWTLRPHRSSFSLKEKKEETNHLDQLPTESDHPHSAFERLGARYLRFR
jgi:hypothetical protein